MKKTNGWNVIGMFFEDISWREFKYCLSWKCARKWDLVYSKSFLLVTKMKTIEQNMKLHTSKKNVVEVWGQMNIY